MTKENALSAGMNAYIAGTERNLSSYELVDAVVSAASPHLKRLDDLPEAALSPPMGVLSKVATIIALADQSFSEPVKAAGLAYPETSVWPQVKTLLGDPDVRAWITSMRKTGMIPEKKP